MSSGKPSSANMGSNRDEEAKMKEELLCRWSRNKNRSEKA